MIGTIYITGEIGVDTTVLNVIKQVKAQPKATELLVKIDSIGGFVSDGMEIYNYLKSLPQIVNTYAIQAYSIASVIFMAGQRRIVNDSNDAILIHLPWMEVAGSHEVIENHLKDLKNTEDSLVKFYSDALQIDKNTIQSLLSKETYLSASQAIELGFATEIKATQKAVAKLNNKEKEEQSSMNKFEKKLDAIYNKVFGIKNELILQDATGEQELVFPELAPTDVAEVGQKATIDGKPADGEILMPDGQTLIFTKGELTKINPAEVEPDAAEVVENADAPEETPAEESDKDALIAELEAKIAELQKQLDEMLTADQVDKLMEAVDSSFDKQVELESKFNALAKSIGSDFKHETKKENTPTVKATPEARSRAWQILNS